MEEQQVACSNQRSRVQFPPPALLILYFRLLTELQKRFWQMVDLAEAEQISTSFSQFKRRSRASTVRKIILTMAIKFKLDAFSKNFSFGSFWTKKYWNAELRENEGVEWNTHEAQDFTYHSQHTHTHTNAHTHTYTTSHQSPLHCHCHLKSYF